MNMKNLEELDTTIDEGHCHTALVDDDGNGYTTEDSGHRHPIVELEIIGGTSSLGLYHIHGVYLEGGDIAEPYNL